MLLEHERDYGLGMDALVSVCSGNTNGVMGECPWSPGTWRRWIPGITSPLRSLDYGSFYAEGLEDAPKPEL